MKNACYQSGTLLFDISLCENRAVYSNLIFDIFIIRLVRFLSLRWQEIFLLLNYIGENDDATRVPDKPLFVSVKVYGDLLSLLYCNK